MLAFKIGLSLDMKRLSRMSKSASEVAVHGKDLMFSGMDMSEYA
jgi:hypothetical protein